MTSRIPQVLVRLAGIALLAVAVVLLVAPLTARYSSGGGDTSSASDVARNCGFGVVYSSTETLNAVSDRAIGKLPQCNAARLDRVNQILVLGVLGATLTIGASFVPYRSTR